MMTGTIYTEKNDCQDCYKCVRHCPVKAIRIEDHRASVVHDLCIYCGKCVGICPAGAKKVRNDLSLARFFVNENKTILSLAPSFGVEFSDYSTSQLIAALRQLGFMAVSETALGAELTSKCSATWLQSQAPGMYLSSCCPAIVQLVSKYYPEYSKQLVPIDSPMQAHSKMLRQHFGEDCKVVFAGPCIAKKQEVADFPGGADVALTFAELRCWLQEENLSPQMFHEENVKNYDFEPHRAAGGANYPVDGGMISTMKDGIATADCSYMSFSGIPTIRKVLENMPQKMDEHIFVELMACEGGCINGPAMTSKTSLAERRFNILHQTQKRKTTAVPPPDNLSLAANYGSSELVKKHNYTEKEISEVLKSLGKTSEKDELNCGGCGYYTCRNFAIAMLDDMAEHQMCVSYMRRVAHNKASVLLQKMPYGVVLVDEKLRIIESNQQFAKLCGNEINETFAIKPGLEGADIRKIIPFHKLIANILEKGLEEVNKDIRMDDKLFHVSIFSIQKYKIVCAILHQLNDESFRKEYLINQMNEVVRDNLAMAQKAAFLLGENASSTETKLQTIIDSFNQKPIENE